MLYYPQQLTLDNMAIANSQIVNPSSPGKIAAPAITIPKTPKEQQTEKLTKALEQIKLNGPKGLEKVFDLINQFIIKIIIKTNEIMYGKGKAIAPKSQTSAKTVNSSNPIELPKLSGIQNALDRGILNLLTELAGIDFCNLLNYVLKLPKGIGFDPNRPPTDLASFEGVVWRIQYKAFQAQKLIDKYANIYTELNATLANNELRNVLREVSLLIGEISSSEDGLQNEEFKRVFPEASIVFNSLSNVLAKVNRFANLQNITPAELQKAVDDLFKIRQVFITIQSFNLASVVGAANFISNGKVLEEFNKVNQFITPGPKVLVLLRKIVNSCNNIVNIANKVLRVVVTAKTIIVFVLLVLKVFYLIRKLLFGNPVPSAFGTMGVQTTIDDINQTTLKEKLINRFVTRLNQIVETLSLISIAATFLISIMTDIIGKLKLIIANIEGCYPDVASEMQDTVDRMTEARNGLQKFLDDYDRAKNRVDKTFGGYTIDVVTEEVADEAIRLKRRYGIARGADGVIAVQSTPTFASLDLIIINEVKVLLVSKGLVNIGFGAISSADAASLLEASNYLGEDGINIDDIQFNIDDLANEQGDDDIGLKSFINNLPGGKALRRRVRNKMIASNKAYIDEVKKTDSNSPSTQKLIAQKESETNKLEIQKLEDEKKDLQKQLLATIPSGAGSAAIIKKINDIDQKIKELKNKQK